MQITVGKFSQRAHITTNNGAICKNCPPREQNQYVRYISKSI